VRPPPSEIANGHRCVPAPRAVERGLSPRTIEAYGRDLAQLATYLDAAAVRRWRDVAPDHLAGFAAALARRRLAPRSRARALVATRRVLRHAGASEAFRADARRGVDSPRIDRTLPRVLRRDETAALIAAAGQGEGPLVLRDRAMLEVLYGAGLRVSELVGLPARGSRPPRRLVARARQGPRRAHGAARRARARAVAHYLEEGWPVLARGAAREPRRCS
jgi:integrase/recombinase XerD